MPSLWDASEILSPTPGQLHRPQQSIVFRACARDCEDGRLDGTNIVWWSDRDGFLGNGEILLRDATPLPLGDRLITAIARDSQGHSVTQNVSMSLGAGLPLAYADLSVHADVAPAAPVRASPFTLTLLVRNDGRDLARTVHLTNRVSAGLTVLAVDAPTGTWHSTDGAILVSLDTIEAKTDAVVTMTLQAAEAGTYTNLTTVVGGDTDPSPANNVAARRFDVLEPLPLLPDLLVTVVESPTSVEAGATGDYLITVVNRGAAAANGVVLTNWLPTAVKLLSATASGGAPWSVQDGEVIARFGSMPIGAEASLRLLVQITEPGPLFDQAAVFAHEPDQEALDNVHTSLVGASDRPTLEVTVDAAGIQLEWIDAPTLILEQSDRLGPTAHWVPASGASVFDPGRGRWRLTLAPEGTARFFRLETGSR